jgi:rRNA-processing protein FCF1
MLMQAVIVDTSAIIFALENRKDIFASIEQAMPGSQILISNGIVEELEMIAASENKNRKSARAALALLAKHNIKPVGDHSYVDDWIVRESRMRRCAVCTNDMELKKRLKADKIKVLSVSWNGILR